MGVGSWILVWLISNALFFALRILAVADRPTPAMRASLEQPEESGMPNQ
jgi:hypothetical protein